MRHRFRRCQRMSRRVRPPCVSARSSPACLESEQRSGSFPYSPDREPTLPDYCFQVYASALSELLSLSRRSGLILFVADLFHPVGGLAVELFLNGDVRHGRSWRSAMPVFLSRRNPDHVSRTDFLDWTGPASYPTAASRHDHGLAQRV